MNIVTNMRRVAGVWSTVIAVMMMATILVLPSRIVLYAEPNEPTLLIGQVKITSSNGQYVTLYNNSDEVIDMGLVQLAYYNNHDLSKSTSSKFINLSGKLAPHTYYLVSDGALFLCFKMTVNAVSLGFSTTSGMLQVQRLSQVSPGGQVSSSLMDWVSWSKTAATGAQTLPVSPSAFLDRVWSDTAAKTTGSGSWQTVSSSGDGTCDLQAQLAASASVPAESTPPAVKAAVIESTVPPAQKNSGLVAPELTELLPNPASPVTDDEGEFIELYNPNDAPYDLGSYRLEAGTSYSRGYTFASGTLAAKSYGVFMITETSLQLSNSEGQVRLLDPQGTVISETAGYEDAPEGSSWSLVADSWQWVSKPSPGVANAISEEDDEGAEADASEATKAKKTSTGKVAGVSTMQPDPSDLDDAAPLHPMVLAGVGLSAVGYALYEYRHDMANRIFQFRRYLRLRRTVRARL